MVKLWLAFEAATFLIAAIGTCLTILWLIAVGIGAYVESRQRRARQRLRNYRVVGVLKP
jgi:hypothetical protein